MAEEEASTAQQILSLLWSIVSTLSSSAVYSALLAFRSIVSSCSSRRAINGDSSSRRGAFSLYEGTVWHERRTPVHHKFAYHVRYALVNLDSAPSWFDSAASRHHLSAQQARSIAQTVGPVYLLTVPTSVGYEQNPLSVYYCFDGNEKNLSCCIAEVTNTPWAERVTFVFDAGGDAVAKPLHVSPFMDMSGTWKIKASVPDKELVITITVQHSEFGNYFTAALKAKRIEKPLLDAEAFFWLMPHKTALGIYWQALRLWWKGVQFYQHPKYIDGAAYRHRAIERDKGNLQKELQGGEGDLSLDGKSSSMCPVSSRLNKRRLYTWREAEWPWN